jgi:hypothetical protein
MPECVEPLGYRLIRFAAVVTILRLLRPNPLYALPDFLNDLIHLRDDGYGSRRVLTPELSDLKLQCGC